MSHADALRIAIKKATYFGIKYYVWGFKSQRGGWFYTVTDHQPDFMRHLNHIT